MKLAIRICMYLLGVVVVALGLKQVKKVREEREAEFEAATEEAVTDAVNKTAKDMTEILGTVAEKQGMINDLETKVKADVAIIVEKIAEIKKLKEAEVKPIVAKTETIKKTTEPTAKVAKTVKVEAPAKTRKAAPREVEVVKTKKKGKK